MTVYINGTTGISGVDGSAGTPAVQGTDTNTGVFYPAADTVGVSTGGSERMRIDSSGNINIATAGARITGDFSNATVANRVMFQTSTSNSNTTVRAIPSGSGANAGWIADNNSDVTNSSFAQFGIVGTTDVRIQSSINGTGTYLPMTFYTGGSERMRIDSSGNLLVGVTATINGLNASGHFKNVNAGAAGIVVGNAGGTSTTNTILFTNSNGTVGGISTSGSATSFNTSSDYRLKNTIAPMTGALAKVALLKPCTYKWNVDGSDGEGFIAHELAEVCPHAVNGEKDAVETYTDEDGNEATRPVYQGIDTSFLVATLTAAIKEQQALITALTARIEALENK